MLATQVTCSPYLFHESNWCACALILTRSCRYINRLLTYFLIYRERLVWSCHPSSFSFGFPGVDIGCRNEPCSLCRHDRNAYSMPSRCRQLMFSVATYGNRLVVVFFVRVVRWYNAHGDDLAMCRRNRVRLSTLSLSNYAQRVFVNFSHFHCPSCIWGLVTYIVKWTYVFQFLRFSRYSSVLRNSFF